MLAVLETLHYHIPGIGLLKYISFRVIMSLLTTSLVVFLWGSNCIKSLKEWQVKGQPIRSDGPETHLKKIGTPTMGGLIILASILVSSLLWGDYRNIYFWCSLWIIVSFGAIGFYDDYLKVMKQNSKGFSAKTRLILEFVSAAFIGWVINMHSPGGISLLFMKNYFINLGWFFIPAAAFVIVGTGNAVNFTDGLDGLAIMPVMISAAAFILIAYLCGNSIFANYLYITYVPGVGEISVVLAALIGAGLGFLWFNAPPAAIFMGDTGSLSLGGLLGCVAVATKQEIVLIIIGGIFVMEALSVIMQVISYKLFRRRIFLMAPIHHHFEKKGWSESQVVIRFWIISIFLSIVGLLTFKLR